MPSTNAEYKISFCGIVGDLRLSPQFNLALQRLEVPLDSVHAHRERINQIEVLGVLGQYKCERVCDNISELREL